MLKINMRYFDIELFLQLDPHNTTAFVCYNKRSSMEPKENKLMEFKQCNKH